ncbi:MAG: ABC transporter permease [Deltaproteobacteria bacterium]|nr:ABC transporter permease [Deltaproteobacteria bacterium]
MTAAALIYLIGDGIRNIKDNLMTATLSAFTVAFALAIFTLFTVVFVNLGTIIDTWGDKSHVVVYVKSADLSELGESKLKKDILGVPGVSGAEFVSRKEALALLKEELRGHESVLDGIDIKALPGSFEVKIAKDELNPAGVARIVKRLSVFKWADEVQSGGEWVEKFTAFLKFSRIFALVVGLFLAAATLFIISNTIRLTLYSRREEIEVMSYLGATTAFIKIPFFLEGVVVGVVGGVMALVVLAFGQIALTWYIPSYFTFIIESPVSPQSLLIIMVISGFLIGGFGSLLSLGRFLRS